MASALSPPEPLPETSAAIPDSGIPAWFLKKRARQEAGESLEATEPVVSGDSPPEEIETALDLPRVRPRRKIVIRTDAPPEEERPWRERILLWVFSSAAAGYLISTLVHSVVLLGLSFIAFRGVPGLGGVNTLIASTDKEEQIAPFENVAELNFDVAGGKTEQLTELVPQQVETLLEPRDLLTPQPDSAIVPKDHGQGQGEGNEAGNGIALGGGFKMPASGKAVQKGSFVAWTVPEDPAPGEAYQIVVQVALPGNRRMRMGDITGTVVGTDGYHQKISKYNKFTRYITQANQVVVIVPGARELVRDVIEVKSQMLHEEQTLEIVF